MEKDDHRDDGDGIKIQIGVPLDQLLDSMDVAGVLPGRVVHLMALPVLVIDGPFLLVLMAIDSSVPRLRLDDEDSSRADDQGIDLGGVLLIVKARQDKVVEDQLVRAVRKGLVEAYGGPPL